MSTTDLLPRNEPWNLTLSGPSRPDSLFGLTDMLLALPSSIVEGLATRGLCVRDPTEADRLALLAAQELILHVPDLCRVVARAVAGISPLSNVDNAFDVSHSETSLGTTILLSIPLDVPLARLRLSEAVVHEAMHLNLSAFEEAIPLVESFELLFSPWRSIPRKAGGVLHGLYVFSCIARFMERLLALGQLSPTERTHARRRLEEIDADIANVDNKRLVANLTVEGVTLINDLLLINKARRSDFDDA